MALDISDSNLVSDGFTLHYQLRRPEERRATVVFSHGFSVDGTESHRMFNDVASAYNQIGLSTIQFDYRGCGYSSGDFHDFTLSGAISDLATVIAWARTLKSVGEIYIHGQSLGSAVASLVAASDDDGPAGLLLWNLSAEIAERYPALFGKGIIEDDHYYLPEKGLATGRHFIEDAERHDILGAFARITAPVLFVNASADEKSSAQYAEAASQRLPHSDHELVLIRGANHSFKCQPELQEEAVATGLAWITSKLL